MCEIYSIERWPQRLDWASLEGRGVERARGASWGGGLAMSGGRQSVEGSMKSVEGGVGWK